MSRCALGVCMDQSFAVSCLGRQLQTVGLTPDSLTVKIDKKTVLYRPQTKTQWSRVNILRCRPEIYQLLVRQQCDDRFQFHPVIRHREKQVSPTTGVILIRTDSKRPQSALGFRMAVPNLFFNNSFGNAGYNEVHT